MFSDAGDFDEAISGLAFCLLVTALMAGCSTDTATLYVDNDSECGLNVEIDGKHALYVSTDRYAKCRVLYGEHRVVVRQKNKVIFDQKKKFEPHADGPSWRHYILDPHADTRYAFHEVYYFKDQAAAKGKKLSRRIRSIPKNHWVSVPKSAFALEPSFFVVTSDTEEKTSRQCVIADK